MLLVCSVDMGIAILAVDTLGMRKPCNDRKDSRYCNRYNLLMEAHYGYT